MERIEVHTFHSNGNDVICKQINAERVNEHILYVSENADYGSSIETYYCLIVSYNGITVKLDRTSKLENITNITLDGVIEHFKNKVEHKLYFNKVELILCKALSEELYEKALVSRNHVLEQRAKEEQERLERRKKEALEEEEQKRLEKARKKKEQEEKKKNNELFLKENSDILKSDLSYFEKITAKNELTKIYRWNFPETQTSVTCSILDLIRVHNYRKLSTIKEEYSKYGDLLKVPKTYYYIGTPKDSLGFQIPAKLGKILILKEHE